MTRKVAKKSELQRLLEKNADPRRGLNEEEVSRTIELIENPKVSKESCWLCKMMSKDNSDYGIEQAIYDTGLCQGHARYAFSTRK